MSPKANPEKFPLTVKAGSASVRIYLDRKGTGNYYRVVYTLGGKRYRHNFSTLEKAKTEAAAKAAQLARGDLDAIQLTGKDRLAYGRALEAIRHLDLPLDAAAIEYAATRKILGPHSMQEAARFYMRHFGHGIAGKTVREAVDEFLKAKTEAGRSEAYLKDIRIRLTKFGKAFDVEVRQLTPQDVAAYLRQAGAHARSFNNIHSLLKTFFGYCVTRRWLSKDADLLAETERRKEAAGQIDIFTAAELEKILNAAEPRTATCIALQAFAGLRTAELLRLTWHDVDRRKGYIEIAADKAKTAARRLVPIHDNLAEWLRVAERGEDSEKDNVWHTTESRYHKRQGEAADAAAVPWKKNALRHSFISYRLAETQDMNKVALEAGNSPKMIFQHYRELCTEAEAKEWFGILPTEK